MRLFVGVELDTAVREAAAEIAESLRRRLGRRVDARWIPAENLHITLWFLGEVEDQRARALLGDLDRPFDESAFDLDLGGLGVFPSGGAPRVFWMGVQSGGECLSRLYEELASRLGPFGFEPERRAYSAHLTIARVSEISRAVEYRDIRATLRALPAVAGRCRIDRVAVFRSRPSPKGASYEALLRIPLK